MIYLVILGSYKLYDRLSVIQPEADGCGDVGVQTSAQH